MEEILFRGSVNNLYLSLSMDIQKKGGIRNMTGLIIISIICISCAIPLWSIADKRGANALFWAVMGAVFGPFAIPFVFLTKKQFFQNYSIKQTLILTWV